MSCSIDSAAYAVPPEAGDKRRVCGECIGSAPLPRSPSWSVGIIAKGGSCLQVTVGQVIDSEGWLLLHHISIQVYSSVSVSIQSILLTISVTVTYQATAPRHSFHSIPAATMVNIKVTATGQINPPGVTPVLTHDQVWRGLVYKSREPQKFVPAIESREILSEHDGGLTRVENFKQGMGPPSGKLIGECEYWAPHQVRLLSPLRVLSGLGVDKGFLGIF